MSGALTIEKKGPLFRLKDIEVDEVSLVDRAANKRKFILVKQHQEDAMPGKTEVVEKDGALVVQESTEQEDATETQGDPGTEKPVVKLEDLALTPDQKADLSGKMQEAMERVLEVTNAVRTAKEDAETPSGGDELLAEVRSAKALLEEVEKTLAPDEAPPAEAGAAPEAQATEAAPAIGKDASEEEIRKAAETHAKLLNEKMDLIKQLAKDIAENASTMDLKDLRAKLSSMHSMGWQIDDLAETVNLSKADGGEEAEPSAVAGLTDEDLEAIKKGDVEALTKIGRKMSGRNLGRFKKSIAEMEKVMKTFLELYQALLPADSTKRDLAKRMLENIGVTQESDYQKDNVGSGKQPDPDARGDMAENAGAEGEMQKQLADLQKRAKEQDKKIAEQEEVIKSLGSTVDAPSSGKPEGAVQKSGGEEKVYWGMDLNDEDYLEREGLK